MELLGGATFGLAFEVKRLLQKSGEEVEGPGSSGWEGGRIAFGFPLGMCLRLGRHLNVC